MPQTTTFFCTANKNVNEDSLILLKVVIIQRATEK